MILSGVVNNFFKIIVLHLFSWNLILYEMKNDFQLNISKYFRITFY